jgi:hypothetical protein
MKEDLRPTTFDSKDDTDSDNEQSPARTKPAKVVLPPLFLPSVAPQSSEKQSGSLAAIVEEQRKVREASEKAAESTEDDDEETDDEQKAKLAKLGKLPLPIKPPVPAEGDGAELRQALMPAAEYKPVDEASVQATAPAEQEDITPEEFDKLIADLERRYHEVSAADNEPVVAADHEAAAPVEQLADPVTDNKTAEGQEVSPSDQSPQFASDVVNNTSTQYEYNRDEQGPEASTQQPTAKTHRPETSPLASVAAGNEAAVPPRLPRVPGGGDINFPGGPSGPASPNFSSPNLPINPNVLTAPTAIAPNVNNVLNSHEHAHGHPNLALAFGAGLLLEHYLGKRADKKITNEMRQQTDRLARVIDQANGQQSFVNDSLRSQQQRLESAQQTQQQLWERQQQVRRTITERPQPTLTEMRQPVVDRSTEAPATPPPLSREVFGTASSSAKSGFEATPMATPDGVEVAMPTGKEAVIPNTDLYAEARVKPSVVMEQVAQAAEQDVPVEIAYERRQEVRDEPGSSGSSGGAMGGGGAGFAPVSAPHSQPREASARQLAETQAYLSTSGQGSYNNHNQYRSASLMGFWTAITLLVVGAAAYLLLQ